MASFAAIRLSRWCFVRPGLLTAAAVASSLFAQSSRALNFQLHTVRTVDDGIPHEHSGFRYDDHTDMMVDLPRGWSTTADAASITSVCPTITGAVVRIEKSTLTPATPFRETGLDVYRQRVLSTVPQGAVNLQIVEEKRDPLPVFGWQDYEFTVAYDFFGQSLRRSIVFINLNAGEQIVMSVDAQRGSFDKIYAQGMEVMRSWSPVPAN